ncbi:MAG: TAXI family TRAP transporter solute-binding subunit [Sulfitobacter sp.]|nr:TAXI family TRAP transporter solute-binding subunit [Sulfitobacter sp.]
MIEGERIGWIARRVCWAALMFLGVVAVALQPGCGWERGGTYSFGTSEQEGAYRDLGAALQEEFARTGQLKLELVEGDGSIDKLARLRDGTLDFALVQGGFEFDETGLQSVASVDLEYLHILVPLSSEVRNFRDLAGKRVASGTKGTGSRTLADRIMEISSLEPPMTLIPLPRDLIGAALSEGRVDAAMFVIGFRREFVPLLRTGRYRLIDIPHAEALAAGLFDVQIGSIPAGVYGNTLAIPSEPLTTLVVHTNILVRNDVPDSAVRMLTEALFTHHVQRAARLPRLTEGLARNGADLDLHPGAVSYYGRNDPITSDQFEIAGVILAVVLAVLGTLRALYEWWKVRQQEVERREVRDLLRVLQAGTVSSQHNHLAVLRDAHQHWVDGRIGDEDLRLVLDMVLAQSVIAHRRDAQTQPD